MSQKDIFCVVVRKNEQTMLGYAAKETAWAFDIIWMTSDKKSEGRLVTIPWSNIDYIMEIPISEADWNQPPAPTPLKPVEPPRAS